MSHLQNYRRELAPALDDDFQRRMLDQFASSYASNREQIFAGQDIQANIADIAARKDHAIRHHDELFKRFCAKAEKLGIHVHCAHDAAEARSIIINIARQHECHSIIKSKSMTAEEIHLNPALEAAGLKVVESDLGEWILQLRGEGPSHMVMPAIHLSRGQVARTFAATLNASPQKSPQEGKPLQAPALPDPDDITALVRLARRELRPHFASADMGISGANFVIADNATMGLVTNEGNARLVTTLPRVHVALCGLDKLVESMDDALAMLRVLPRNATAQHLTSYVSWIRGAAGPNQSMHMVFLDNGRSAMARDPLFSQVLRCVRCGACANLCPIYRLVGGHKLGEVYIGAIGLILTWFFHDRQRAKALIQNCTNCQSCKSVCGAGIDLPRLIEALRKRAAQEDAPVSQKLMGQVLKRNKVFHGLLRLAAHVQSPFTGHSPFVQRWPGLLLKTAPRFVKEHEYRALPALAPEAFRHRWPDRKPLVPNPRLRIALFAGCAQDFIYPEQLDAALALFARMGVETVFPEAQGCCGLPLLMLGDAPNATQLARTNLHAFTAELQGTAPVDAIVTLCASCASHLKHGYLHLLGKESETFSAKITDFSSFVQRHLPKNIDLPHSAISVAYHAPCHLCRGLGVREEPRALIQRVANYLPSPEEETCCGFGGTYTIKFPEISAELLHRKLDNAQSSGADMLVTDCPGCLLHLRGGVEKQKRPLQVLHMAELLHISLQAKKDE